MFIALVRSFPKPRRPAEKQLGNERRLAGWLSPRRGLLLDNDQFPERTKPFTANPAHNDQMLWPAKRAKLFTMLNDSFSQALSDSGQRFQLLGRSGVDVDALRF